jgi:hypothetical protein
MPDLPAQGPPPHLEHQLPAEGLRLVHHRLRPQRLGKRGTDKGSSANGSSSTSESKTEAKSETKTETKPSSGDKAGKASGEKAKASA